MASQKQLDKAAKLAKKVKKKSIRERSVIDNLLSLLDTLFFGTIDGPHSHIDASKALNDVGVTNKVGEEDSFGPLSWGVQLPHNNEWVWFG